MLTMSTYSEKSWNSSECDYEDDNSSTSSPVQRRNNSDIEVNGTSVITTHSVSSVIKPGDKQLHDPLQFVKIKSNELSQKAKEQIKLAEEVKITKEKIKEIEEEWQTNLLSWKSKRRQGKRNSEEELEDRNANSNSRKIKTFNEILNEKAKSGHRIGYNLHHYLVNEEEDNLLDSRSTESNAASSTDQTDHQTDHQANVEQFDGQQFEAQQNQQNSQAIDQLNDQLNDRSDERSDDRSEDRSSNDEDLQRQEAVRSPAKEYGSNNLSQKANAQAAYREERKANHQLNNSQTSISSSSSSVYKQNEHKQSFDSRQNDSKTNNSMTGRYRDQFAKNSDSLDDEPDESGKKLSFRAKLSAFESLAKSEPKKPLEKTPPVKNKLRMSSSNQLIADKKPTDEKQEAAGGSGGFAKRYTSKSNENLSKLASNPAQPDKSNVNKRSELSSTRSESNLTGNPPAYSAYQQAPNDHTQSDQQLNQQLNQALDQTHPLADDDLLTTRSGNEASREPFDCDYEVSELSRRMHQMSSTSPPVQPPNSTHSNVAPSLISAQTTANHPVAAAHSTHSAASIQTSQFMNSMEELAGGGQLNNQLNSQLNNQLSQQSSQLNSQLNGQLNSQLNSQAPGSHYFNDDYANSQLYNQHQLASHNLISNLPGAMPDYASTGLYQPSKQSSISASILPQNTGNYYGGGNLGANAYQLQKHRSTSSSHLEYANGLPPVTNPIYSGAKPAQSYSASQLMNRQSQPQLNLISGSAVNPAALGQSLGQPLNQSLGQPLGHPLGGQHPPAQQSYNYNHWLIQEAELRRQIATRNGSSLIASTKGQQNCLQPHNAGNLYKDDQPVYENTIIYNSHKKQQQQQLSANSMPYLAANSQINKPPFPNPSMSQTSLISSSMIGNQPPAMMSSSQSMAGSQQQSNYLPASQQQQQQQQQQQKQQKQILSVSGKKKCSSCGDELGRGCAAMVIETLQLYYHINCFRCSVCHVILGNGTCGTDVRVRNHKLHCSNCYSNEETGLKFSRV